MGKTGESLLIGPDQLVRTDSYLQPKRYSVTRSFLFPGQSRLDSEAASRALAGQSGIGFLTDYTGKDVLASYAPFKYKDLNWAIVVKKGRDEALASVRNLWKVGGSIFIVTLVVVIVIDIYFTRLVLKPLGAEPVYMQQIARSIAKGDLTVTVPPCDRKTVMGTLNEMVQNLRHMVSQITEQTREQHQVAHQLSSVSEQTNQSLHEQAEHTTMAATSVTQMSESFREVSENIQRAAGRSNDSKNQIEQSSADVIATSNVLHEVADEFKASAQTVDDLTGEVSRISSALESIQKIADQTNLLALNAAIEAARAGENGRGFAVVADEVRALASNTQRETEQVSDIIQSLQHSSKATQTQMQTSVNRAEAMCEQAAQTAENLRSAAESLDEVAQMNENVASASEEQNHVAMEISGNVESLRAAITETEQSMNDIAASSSTIAKSSDNLQNLIKQFKV